MVAGKPTTPLAMNQYIVACKARPTVVRSEPTDPFAQATRQAAMIDCGESPRDFEAFLDAHKYNSPDSYRPFSGYLLVQVVPQHDIADTRAC
jgi:hypothetical protein